MQNRLILLCVLVSTAAWAAPKPPTNSSQPPAITSISPSSVAAGSAAFTLTVNGSGFQRSTAYWNGSPLTTTVISSSQLRAAIPAADVANAGNASIQVHNSGKSGGWSNTVTFTVTSAPPPGLAITATPSPQATVGAAYSSCASAAGGTAPYTWSIPSGALPPGLTMNATTGCVTGTPSAAGSYAFTLACTDAAATQVTANTGISVADATALTFTTTLAAESGNNTSASSSMTLQGADGQNATPGNVSKIDVHTLLTPSLAGLPVYTAMQGWWTKSGHACCVGYSSTDPAQVQKQLQDMLSRGINGMTMAWYGQGDMSDSAFDAWRQAVEASGSNFKIALRINSAILDSSHCPSADLQGCVISQLQYASKYFSSPAYMTYDAPADNYGARPVVTFFFTSTNSTCCDWTVVRNSVTGNFNPILITRKDKGGFNGQTPNMDGGYAWGEYPDGFAYDTDFDAAALSYPNQYIWSDASKGFNDQLASWGQNRITPQRCGNRWLDTWNHLNSDFSAAAPSAVDGVQITTWNDYEEGTEIETGIDNCYSVNAPIVNAGTVSWSMTASDTTNASTGTIDHFTLYLGDANGNLALLQDNIPADVTSVALPASIPAGTWKIYVKMVGRPSILNRMSAATSFTK